MRSEGVPKIEVLPPGARRWMLAAAIGSLVLGCLGLAAVAFAQKKEGSGAAAAKQTERFQGTAALKDKAGKAKTVRLAVHNWTLLGEQHIDQFPEHGFLLVQLLSGKVTTVIDGKTEKRNKGEFWVVPANAKMGIDARGEVTGLEITVLSVP
jgi:quercetin dioxygenase-like cupin family protein